MKKITIQSTDPDILGSFPALRRAAKAARELSKKTGTPFYVMERGKIVDLNPVGGKQSKGRAPKKRG
jgi:hypothetical protein